MPLEIYTGLENTSWHCFNCGMPQFTSSLMKSFQDKTSETSLNDSFESEVSIGLPVASSSPLRVRHAPSLRAWDTTTIRVANFQSVKNKKVELAQVASTCNPDVILGTETWLNNEIQSSEIFPQNYTAFRRDRKDGFGGVVIVTRNDLICEEIVNVNINTESIYCKIELQGNKSVVVGVVYRPPNSNTDYMRMVCEEMEEIRRKHRNAVLWIGGDFNLPDINWSTLDIQGNANANAINQSFIDMTSNIGLEQQVNFPTRGEAILDLFLTNRPSLVEKCASLPSLGDH